MNPCLLVICARLPGGYLELGSLGPVLALLRLFHSKDIGGTVSDFLWHDQNERKERAEFSAQKMWS